jgi:hypothetical protein
VVSEGFQGVWVFAEQRNGRLKSVAYELLAEGRKPTRSILLTTPHWRTTRRITTQQR